MTRTHIVALTIAWLCVSSASAQTLATLRVKSYDIAAGAVTLVLQSGKVVEIAESDFYGLVAGGQAPPPAISVAPTPAAPSPVNTPPPPAAAPPAVAARCEKDWPSDLRMQTFCQTRQMDALTALAARDMNTGDGPMIRKKCVSEWPGDYRMQNVCEDQALKALEEAGR